MKHINLLDFVLKYCSSTSPCRRLFVLNETSPGQWRRSELCMGDGSTCTGNLVGEGRARHILSFGEDEDGELYILTTSTASPTRTEGIVYQVVDPAR